MNNPVSQSLVVDALKQEDITAFFHCIEKGETARVEEYLNLQPGLMRVHYWEYKASPLMQAVRNNQGDILRLLLRQGADIDQVDKDGDTALHWAVLSHKPDMARLLLENGANIDITNRHGQTAEDRARSQTNDHVWKCLQTWREERRLSAEKELHAWEKARAEEAARVQTETRLQHLKRLAPPKPVLKRKM